MSYPTLTPESQKSAIVLPITGTLSNVPVEFMPGKRHERDAGTR